MNVVGVTTNFNEINYDPEGLYVVLGDLQGLFGRPPRHRIQGGWHFPISLETKML